MLCNSWTEVASLRQSCILHHAIEDSSLRYEVRRSVKLCDLSLVQHQHSAGGDQRVFHSHTDGQSIHISIKIEILLLMSELMDYC